MKRDSINRSKEICAILIDLEEQWKQLNTIERELEIQLIDSSNTEFYLSFHFLKLEEMRGFSKSNPYIFKLIDYEKDALIDKINKLTKELEDL